MVVLRHRVPADHVPFLLSPDSPFLSTTSLSLPLSLCVAPIAFLLHYKNNTLKTVLLPPFTFSRAFRARPDMGGGVMLGTPSLLPQKPEHPVGQRIKGIYTDRLRQFTATGQYEGQNLVSYGSIYRICIFACVKIDPNNM